MSVIVEKLGDIWGIYSHRAYENICSSWFSGYIVGMAAFKLLVQFLIEPL